MACGRRPDTGDVYRELSLETRRGNYPHVLEQLKNLTARNELERWQFRLLEAENRLYRGEWQKALPLVEGKAPAELSARRFYLRGFALRQAGRIAEARRALEQALDEARQTKDRDVECEALLQEERVLVTEERNSDADQLLKNLERIAPNDYYRGSALLNRGHLRMLDFQFEPAIELLERADALTRAAGSEVANSVAVFNMAVCRARLGDPEQARESLEKLAAFHRKLGSRPLSMLSEGGLGDLLRELGDLTGAVAALRRGVEAAAGWSAKDEARLCGLLASALVDLGQVDEAEKWNERASDAFMLPNEAAIAERRGQLDKAIELYRETATTSRNPADKWDAKFAEARLCRAKGQRGLMHRAYREALATVEKAQAALQRTDFKITFLSRLIRNYQNYVAALLEDGDIDTALALEESSRGRVLAGRTGSAEDASGEKMTRAGLRALARECRATLLSYWIAPQGSHVWVATPAKVERIPLGITPGKLQELVSEHRRLVEARRDVRTANSPGAELWRQVVAPAAEHLGPRVLMVPDGPLHEVNFESLVTPKGEYWLNDVTISVAPSFSTMGAAHDGSKNLLLVGDPISTDPEFGPLTYARQELEAIRRALPDRVTELSRGQATPEAFLEVNPAQYGYIHFTAHAKANRQSPLDSAVILSERDGRYKLYAREVMDLRLSARLVTVSACRSAGARAYSGEGLIGFAWAFLRAGASNVIAGLWDVGDATTAELMKYLYAGLARGDTPAIALRNAKLDLVRTGPKGSRPFSWAPFQTYTRAKS